MDTTIIAVLATGAGTVIAIVGLVSRSIGNLRSHMDQKIIDILTHANQQGYDAIGARIDAQGAELRNELGGRLERVEIKLAQVSEDVAFIKGRMTAQPDD